MFVFKPSVDGVSDTRVQKAMLRLSANGRLAYTETQLYYAAARPKRETPGLRQRLFGTKRPEHVVPWGRKRAYLGRATFSQRLLAWRASGFDVPGRLLGPDDIRRAPNRTAPVAELSPEIAAHGFDRVLVVDRAEVAVMLVTNGFHVDHRCAVISADGYPETFLGPLLQLLNQNPNLTVAVAHGARVDAIDLAERLRTWFPAPTVRIFDVGLRPQQVTAAGLFTTTPIANAADPTVADHQAISRLSQSERDWLAWGLSTDLESLAYQQLTRVIARAFGHVTQADERRLGAEGDLDWGHSDSVIYFDGWGGPTDESESRHELFDFDADFDGDG